MRGVRERGGRERGGRERGGREREWEEPEGEAIPAIPEISYPPLSIWMLAKPAPCRTAKGTDDTRL